MAKILACGWFPRGGGYQPRWSHDGTELFYVDAAGVRTSVPVSTTGAFTFGSAKPLFNTGLLPEALRIPFAYEVMPDGNRFLIIQPPLQGASQFIRVVVNWQELLKR